MMNFSCPHCKTELQMGNGIGKVARCPKCLTRIELPKPVSPSVPFASAREPATVLSATAAASSSPERPADTLDPSRHQVRRRRNVLLLGFALTGLACAGFMIVDFIAKNDALKEPERPFRPPVVVNSPKLEVPRPVFNPSMRPAPPTLQPIKPVRSPVVLSDEGTARAQVPVVKARLRLGRLRFNHGEMGQGLAIAPGERMLGLCGVDGLIRLWDLETGVPLKRLSGMLVSPPSPPVPGPQPPGEAFCCLALSRDGQWVAAGTRTGFAHLWELATGKEMGRWQIDQSLHIVGFTPDSQTLACVGTHGGTFLPEVPRSTVLRTWSNRPVRALAFSPDSKLLAACPGFPDMHGSVLLLDLSTGQPHGGLEMGRIESRPYIAMELAFSPDGKTLATCGQAGALHLWELATRKYLRSLQGHSGNVAQVVFSPDGKTLASRSSDVRLWDVDTGKQRWRCQRPGHLVETIAFSKDGSMLYTVGQDGIRRWDTASGKEQESDAETGATTAATISPDGQTAVTAGNDAVLQAWDLRTGHPIRQYRGHQATVQCLAYSSDGRLLASATDRFGDRRKSELRLWEAGTGRELRRLYLDTFPISQVRFLPGSKLLAAVEGRFGQVHVWETSTGEEIHQLGGNRAAFSAFSPDGSLLSLWQQDSVCVWDAAENQLVRAIRPRLPAQEQLQRSGILLAAVALSPGGRYVGYAARNEAGSVHVLNVATGETMDWHQARGSAGRATSWRETVNTLSWSHDGKTLAAGGGDGEIWLWDLATGRALARCEGHEQPILGLAFSSDDRTLISRSGDMIALVWDLSGVREVSRR